MRHITIKPTHGEPLVIEMPETTGTDKQVAWAHDIQSQLVQRLLMDTVLGLNKVPMARVEQELLAPLRAQESAKWWIDNARQGWQGAVKAAMAA